MSLRLMVGVPCHSGSIVLQTAATLLAAQRIVRDRGGSFWFSSQGGATISLVRNAIVAQFLSSEAEILLMLDADQGIDGVTIERMVDLNRPVVGCLYPMRKYNWANVHLGGGPANPELIQKQAVTYVGCLDADEAGQVSITEGFARASHVGTGAILVRREAFERLIQGYPELRGLGFGEDVYPGLEPNWGFFNPVSREDGLPLSEDISFCRRWTAIGGEIWADVASTTTHVGMHAFSGSYLESWKAHQEA